jgi:hypothetical protein
LRMGIEPWVQALAGFTLVRYGYGWRFSPMDLRVRPHKIAA